MVSNDTQLVKLIFKWSFSKEILGVAAPCVLTSLCLLRVAIVEICTQEDGHLKLSDQVCSLNRLSITQLGPGRHAHKKEKHFKH